MNTLFAEAKVARGRASEEVGYRPDGTVRLVLGGQSPVPACELGKLPLDPKAIHYHPLKTDSLEDVLARLQALRAEFPDQPIHGLSPSWVQRHGKDALQRAREAGLDSFAWFSGPLDGSAPAAAGWEELAQLDVPKVACFCYGPHDSEAALNQRIHALAAGRDVRVLVPLPASVGDLVLLSNLTTDGLQDVSVLVRCRQLLPESGRVRASWAALGWKLAQSTLGFGADQLAGWGMEEFLAYTQKLRPSSVVGREEARAGVKEAGRQPLEVTACS